MTIENVVATVEASYEGSPVPFLTVVKYAECAPDDVTRAVKSGGVRLVRKVVGPGGVLLRGLNSLFLVPSYVEV